MFSTFRKGLIVFACAVLVAASFGCACMNTTTPTPTVKPTATLMPTSAPSPTASAEITGSPDLSASPGIGSEIMQGIENFTEGADVKQEEVPEIVKAVEEKYSGAKIVSIKQTMQQNQQVYAVEIEADGKVQTVYAKPDGTLLDSAGSTAGGSGGSGSGNS